jgi:hypothetical protein
MAWKGRAWAGNRHSDKKKFRSNLNRPESQKMSERLLKALRKSELSKPNASVRFPSPAPAFSKT